VLSHAPQAGPPPGSSKRRLRPYLALLRPANTVTAVADVAAGAAVAGALLTPQAAAVAIASAAIYAGGVALNDVCDAELDAAERPERPIPSGAADRDAARALACGLLAFGVLVAWGVGVASGLAAMAIASLVVAYDARAKSHPLFGPLAMGGCRALNLLLGVSLAPLALGTWALLALLPLAYVGAITLVSRGEVRAQGERPGRLAWALVAAVVASLFGLGLLGEQGPLAWAFVGLFALRVLPPFAAAARRPHPLVCRRAVRAGVLSVIPLNAAIAASVAGAPAGLAVLALWPLAGALARRFAVT
jgi:4-hydroxybenzoate polyprenyltransferase